MKLFFSEYRALYATYTFSYSVYAVAENRAELPDVYARGFLPYSARTDNNAELFYLSRSLRVDTEQFAESSENRRVLRKVGELGIELQAVSKAEFDVNGVEFRRFCLEYAEERFKGGEMRPERLAYILKRDTLTHILVFRSQERVYGYVFVAVLGEMLHYWFSFYDTAFLQTHSLGKFLMLETIRWAKANGSRYVYLGTCYRNSALYKVRDHKGAEWFDGIGWNRDTDLLKALCQRDDASDIPTSDLFQQPEAPFADVFAQTLTTPHKVSDESK